MEIGISTPGGGLKISQFNDDMQSKQLQGNFMEREKMNNVHMFMLIIVSQRLFTHKWHEMGNESTYVYLSCMGHGTDLFSLVE